MKDMRVIRIKSQQLRRLRYFLRQILLEACYAKEDILWAERDKLLHSDERRDGIRIRPTQEERDLANAIKSKMNALTRGAYNSIIWCHSCNSGAKDMLYSKELNMWFCEECADENLEDWLDVDGDYYYYGSESS